MSKAPLMTSADWSPYCMTLFVPGETDGDGNPKVHGLRRVAELLIGQIISTDVTVVQAPNPENEYSACVTCRIEFSNREGTTSYFSGAADANPINVEPAFARYATAMAETRAKARAFREALRLKCVAAEELTSLPVVERPTRNANPIEAYQVNGLLKSCRDMAIDPMKYINSGGSNYGSVDEMSKESGTKALKLLNKYFQDQSQIPEEILL